MTVKIGNSGIHQLIITIIEDDYILNQLIQKTLEREGYATQGFLYGKEALDWLRNNPAEETLFLIDYQLSDTLGEDLVKSIQQIRPDFPFVIITGHGDERTAVKMMKLGAIDYLVKDNSFIDLLPSVIHQVISRLSILKQLYESQQALRQSEEKHRSIFENIQDVYFELTLEGDVIELSPSVEQVLNYRKEDLVGRPLFENKNNLNTLLEHLNLKGYLSDFEMLLGNKSKEMFPCSVTCKYIYDYDGEAKMIVGTIRNITLRKQIEENLRLSEERYRLLAENSSDLISKHSWDGTYMYVSPASQRLLGYSPEEMMGNSAFVFIHPDDIENIRQNHIKLLEKHQENFIESYRIRKKNGDYIWFETNNQVVFSPKTLLVEEIVCVSRDITLRREHEDLVRAKEVAENSNKAKSEFLANMSHEIRNPLNAIIGMTRTMAKTNLSQEQESYINSVLISAGNLLHILNDILDYSKIEANKVDITLTDFNLKQTIKDTIELFEPQARLKGLSLVMKFDANVPEVIHCDEKKINQILINLLSNAIKFTNTGEVEIGVNVKSVNNENILLKIFVKDTGIGVKAENIPKIFDSFQQLDISSRKEYQGTGLGLTIVKSLVELMNGSIKFESTFGKGSTVSFEIPVVISQDLQFENNGVLLMHNETNAQMKKLHILVAEDDAINQMYLAGFLRSHGWKVDTAANGLVAIEKYASNSYDLVLMDGQMPKMDGFEATRRIREMELNTGRRIPIIAITGYAIAGDRERFINAGMDDYVSKPIDELKLMAIIFRMTH